MPYSQKEQAGRGPKQKTGAGIPSALLQNDEKSGSKLTREEEVQKRYPGAKKREGTLNEYDLDGVTLNPGYKKKEELSDSDKIKKAINEQSPAKQNGMKYDIKEASNQKLSAKARKNYAENAQHDSKKGYR